MRVLQLIGMGAPKFGGFEKYTLELARRLSAAGDSMLVVFSKEPANREYIELLDKIPGMEWMVIGSSPRRKFLSQLRKTIRRFRPDIIHTNFSRDVVYGLLVGKLCGVRTFSTLHCMPEIRGLRGRLSYWFRAVMSDRLLAVSATISDYLKEHAGIDKAEPLYLGVEEFHYDKAACRKKYFADVPQDNVIITSVAFHDPVKGVDIMLRTLAILKYELGVDNFTAALVGGGSNTEYTASLHALAKELKIDSHVDWMGIRNTVPEILSASDIYCQSSRSEGISLAIMEASVAGLPTVAFRTGGMPEAARERQNALLAEPLNEMDLAEKLALMIKDPVLRAEMGGKAKEIAAADFNISQQVGKLLGMYRSVVR